MYHGLSYLERLSLVKAIWFIKEEPLRLSAHDLDDSAIWCVFSFDG